MPIKLTISYVCLVGISPPEFDSLTLAVIRGRLVRYLMRSKEVQSTVFVEECREVVVMYDTAYFQVNLGLSKSF